MRLSEEELVLLLGKPGYGVVGDKPPRHGMNNSLRNDIIINELQSHSSGGGTPEPVLTMVPVKETPMANDDSSIPAPRRRPSRKPSLPRPSRNAQERAEHAQFLEDARQAPPEDALNLLTYPTRLAHTRVVAHCTIPGNPGVKDRPRFVKATGAVFTPKATKDSEREIGLIVKMARQELLVEQFAAFGLRILFYVRDGQRKDIDNMTKLVFDGITGVIWEDDSQVKEMMVWSMEDPIHPRTELVIYKLGFPANPFHVCAVCRKPFRVYPSWEGRLYCSRKCASFAQRNRVVMSCAHCGTQLERIASEANRSREYFCSAACKTLHQTAELVCTYCRRAFRRPQSLIKRRQNAYCSQICLGKDWNQKKTSPAAGICQTCGGPVTRKTYTRCKGCQTEQEHALGHTTTVHALYAEGHTKAAIARQLGISSTSVTRILRISAPPQSTPNLLERTPA